MVAHEETIAERDANVTGLRARLESICDCADELESKLASEISQVHPRLRDSARNLVHYIALRHADIRDMQRQLESLGLSSLGRAELHTMSSVRSVLKALESLYFGETRDIAAEHRDFSRSARMLAEHAGDLLGEMAGERAVRIMVTLPRESATSYDFVSSLVRAGMDIARINTAHDDQDTWRGMIENIRRANREQNSSCKIVMDLAGPKIRTGPLKPGPRVLRVRPRRDPLGRVIAPRRLRLVDEGSGRPTKRQPVLPVAGPCVAYARKGDVFTFRDTRGKKRKLKVVHKDDNGLVVEAFKTAYIQTGSKLRLKRKDTGDKMSFRIGELPSIGLPLLLRIGDILILHSDSRPGEPAVAAGDGHIVQAAHIACSPPEVLRFVSSGATVRLNDGKIEGIVRSVAEGELRVEITKAKATGSRLRGGKGINFPDSDTRLTGLTDTDKANLAFVAEHADAIGLSYVKGPDDVYALQDRLAALPPRTPGIILKIETERAFHNLPHILLAAMRNYPLGVMIARGDLAVECGWERLAEIQEEILWLCEAARVPVIWATQVLEGKTKKGWPSRAEISDAAMAQRADCVMLNKGPYIVEAIKMLHNILTRMQGHQDKKTPMLRKLSISDVEFTQV